MGRKRIEMRGKKFGRLTVLREADTQDASGGLYYTVQCDCGSPPCIKRGAELRRGGVKSCGCLNKEHLDILHEKQRKTPNKKGANNVLGKERFPKKIIPSEMLLSYYGYPSYIKINPLCIKFMEERINYKKEHMFTVIQVKLPSGVQEYKVKERIKDINRKMPNGLVSTEN